MTQSATNQAKQGAALGKFMPFVQLFLKMIGRDEWHTRPVVRGMDKQAVSENLNLIKSHLMRGGSSETHAPFARVLQQRSTRPEDIELMVTGYLDAVAKLNLFLQSTSVTTADLLRAFKGWHVSVTRRLLAREYRSELSNGREVATLFDALLTQRINGRNVYKVVGDLYYELHKLHPFTGGGNHRAIMLLVNYATALS